MDLATELAMRAKMTPLFGRAMPYDGGEYGEGVLSKYSFVSTRVVALPHSPGREPRAALEARVQLPSGDVIAVIGTHLDHLRDETDRLAQANTIIETFAGNDVPTMLAGDLNAEPGSATIDSLTNHWAPSSGDNPEPTHPSKKPARKIDYVMVAPKGKWKVVDTKVIVDDVASDHCAYMATLELLR
jgi:endonuclease/exonuclease/phosphatase family metal-dependent hydrolase